MWFLEVRFSNLIKAFKEIFVLLFISFSRTIQVESIPARKAQKLMHRMNMMRQIHDWRDSLADRRSLLKLCSNEAMPSGWSVEQDEELFKVVDEHGLDNITANVLSRTAFQKVII